MTSAVGVFCGFGVTDGSVGCCTFSPPETHCIPNDGSFSLEIVVLSFVITGVIVAFGSGVTVSVALDVDSSGDSICTIELGTDVSIDSICVAVELGVDVITSVNIASDVGISVDNIPASDQS